MLIPTPCSLVIYMPYTQTPLSQAITHITHTEYIPLIWIGVWLRIALSPSHALRVYVRSKHHMRLLYSNTYPHNNIRVNKRTERTRTWCFGCVCVCVWWCGARKNKCTAFIYSVRCALCVCTNLLCVFFRFAIRCPPVLYRFVVDWDFHGFVSHSIAGFVSFVLFHSLGVCLSDSPLLSSESKDWTINYAWHPQNEFKYFWIQRVSSSKSSSSTLSGSFIHTIYICVYI